MGIERFIIVGENIHCTRVYKVGGKFVTEQDGRWVVAYRGGALPVPPAFTEGAEWEAGKVKHCAVAIWQGTRGDAAGKDAGVAYLKHLAQRQEAAGAAYLDINVDEFSTDVDERVRMMQWTVGIVQDSVSVPVSIDSSNLEVLKAGLAAAGNAHGRPMVNSVSLERADAVEAAAEHKAVVIASAAGETGMPSSTEERLANFDKLMPRLQSAGFALADIHADPLVFPISVDGMNGKRFLDAVAGIRKTYGGEIHIVAGLSNVSFGMPQRKLINQVFSYLAVEAGADGGIVDPLQINADILNGLDPASERFRLAKALLTGEDAYGMEFITAAREGQL
ncbi:MAG: dihydropteroate synthase [Lentisphaerae bacterium]|nr:dihydropteroate synthase [Lentisphaerota bacterium]